MQTSPPRERSSQAEVYVGGFEGLTLDQNELREVFSQFGEITSIHIPRRANSNFIFITFSSPEVAMEATKKMAGMYYRGRRLNVLPAARRTKIFVGNIPKAWSRQQLLDGLKAIGAGDGVINLDFLQVSVLDG